MKPTLIFPSSSEMPSAPLPVVGSSLGHVAHYVPSSHYTEFLKTWNRVFLVVPPLTGALHLVGTDADLWT